MKTGYFALVILLTFGGGATATKAQQAETANQAQSAEADPLAAAARHVREERKDQPKAAKVYTNDNLPTNGTISYVGPSASTSGTKDAGSSTADPAAANPNAKAGAKASGSEDKSADQAALARAKQQLESAKKDLDIEQRKFALDQQSYMSSPNHDSDKQTAVTLQTEQDDISAKKDEVDAAQKLVNDLEAKLAASSSGRAADNSAPTGDSGNGSSGTSSTNSSSTSAGNAASSSHPF